MQRINEIFPLPKHENRTLWVQYLPHALRVLSFRGLDQSTDKAALSRLIFNTAGSQSILGKYKEAGAMHQQALGLRTEVLGAKHPDTLTSLNNLALVLSRQGKDEEAETIHRRTHDLFIEVLGTKHPDTLSSMINLACELCRQGKDKEAEAMHRQALDLHTEVLGTKHPNTLTSISNLARTLNSQGKYEQAEA
ncbi:hypothetical protein IL306_013511, partial [Fusarium sp. DS 682]